MTYTNLDNTELLHVSLDAIHHDRSADAIAVLKTLLERDPDHVFATYLLAAQHAQLAMMDRAEEGFRRTVHLAPDFPIARFQLGQLCLVKGDVADAKATLAPLVDLPDAQALPHYARGLIAAADDDAAGAIAHLQAGLACPQEIPALASDMQRVIANLQSLGTAAVTAAAPEPAASLAPIFLTAYGKTSH